MSQDQKLRKELSMGGKSKIGGFLRGGGFEKYVPSKQSSNYKV